MANDRDEFDPADEQPPDFSRPEYTGCVQELVSDERSEEQAHALLLEVWQIGHDERVARWQQRQEERRRGGRGLDGDGGFMREFLDANGSRRRRVFSLDTKRIASDSDRLMPSANSLRKLAQEEAIALWEFSPEGCREAARLARVTEDDTLRVTASGGWRRGDDVTSDAAIKDEDLTLEQFVSCEAMLIYCLELQNRSQDYIQDIVDFFFEIKRHPKAELGQLGIKALMIYVVAIRRERALEAVATGKVFPLAKINETRLEKIFVRITAVECTCCAQSA